MTGGYSTPQQSTAAGQDSGLWKRGFIVFGLVGAIAGMALWTALYRPGVPDVEDSRAVRAEYILPMLITPEAGFPGGISWAAVRQLHDSLPSTPGWEIRYNATLALARRGSEQVRLDVLGEMLDEQKQLLNFRAERKDGRNVPNETDARGTILSALGALAQWHKKMGEREKFGPENAELQQVYEAVSRLTRSPNLVLRTEAEKVQKALRQNGGEGGAS